jgi:WD40 repeat protein
MISALAVTKSRHIATSSREAKAVNIFDLSFSQEAVRVIQFSKHQSIMAALSEDVIVSADYWHGQLRAWNVRTGEIVHATPESYLHIGAMAALSDTQVIFAAYGTLHLWNLELGRVVDLPRHHSGYVTSLAVLNDNLVASFSNDPSIILWDVANLRVLNTLDSPSDDWDHLSAVLPGGHVVSLSTQGNLRLWDFAGPRVLRTDLLDSSASSLVALAHNLVATSSYEGVVQVFNIAAGSAVARLTLDFGITELSACPGTGFATLIAGDVVGGIHVLRFEESSSS